ncbi:MAG: hypothetical protein ACOYM3_12790 [Terrimicrobiaceae bacterium]
MRFNNPLPRLILSFAFLATAICPLLAQEELPEPSPTPASAGIRSSVSFARLWYVGGPKAPRITVALQSGQAPQVVASYVRPGRLGSYRLTKPGANSVMILDGSVIPDATGQISAEGKSLAQPIAVNFKGGAFNTIIVEEKDGKLFTTIIEDKPPSMDTGPAFRIFDYTGSTNESVQIVSRDKPVEVWKSSTPTPITKLLTGLQGPVSVQLGSIRNGTPVVLSSYETEVTPSKSYSIVLSFDRYGERSLSFVEDADSNANAEQIREFLKAN